MIGKSLPEYLFIRCSIFALGAITPASFAYLAACLAARHVWISPALAAWAAGEAAFFTLVYYPRKKRLQKDANEVPPPLTREERKAFAMKCFTNTAEADPSFPDDWFTFTTPGAQLRKDNVVEWLLWSLWACRVEDAPSDIDSELDEYVTLLEQLRRFPLPDGYDPGVKSKRLTVDEVKMHHRPLVWYFIVGLVDTISMVRLRFSGLKHCAPRSWFTAFPSRPLSPLLSSTSPSTDLPYWYRPHRSSTKLPVVFIHGIGIGLYPYIPFFQDILASDPEVGLIAIELLPICMHITAPLPSRHDLMQSIQSILSAHGFDRVVLVSHSYGTVVAAHVLHSALRPQIAGLLLVDPIPILLHVPAVAHSFVYRAPTHANEWQLWYFASRDADISRALGRHFFWTDNVLWREELVDAGIPVAVSLSGEDQIVPSAAVHRYLTGEDKPSQYWTDREGLEVLWYPGLDHATVFDTAERLKPLLDIVRRDMGDAIADTASQSTRVTSYGTM